ncbi:MAG: hypothetical protein AAF290_00530 [Pseudomonadota bacterium]
MLLWLSLTVFLIPLVYILSFGRRASGRRDRRARQRELERIQQQVAAKQQHQDGDTDN